MPSKPIGTRSVLWTMSLAAARIHHCSMSRVTPRSWPTTIPGVTISTAWPRSASSSATDVAWWKPISSITTIDPTGAATPASTSCTSATLVTPAATHHGRCGAAPVATMTWSGRRAVIVSIVASTPHSIVTP